MRDNLYLENSLPVTAQLSYNGTPQTVLFGRNHFNYLAGLPELGFELLGEIHGVVDKGESGGLSTTEVGLESECNDAVRSALVHLGQLFADLGLGDRGPVGVEDIHDHLLPLEEPVGHVLAGTHGNTSFVNLNK